MKQKLTLIMLVFLTTIACGTVMLPIDSLIHWGDVGHTANVVNQYLVWETVEVDASLINVDPTLAAQTPDAVGPLLETPRAMIEFMATIAGVTPFPQGTPISEETPAACREDPPGPSCPPPPPATPTPVITVTAVISNSDCASVSVVMENTANLVRIAMRATTTRMRRLHCIPIPGTRYPNTPGNTWKTRNVLSTSQVIRIVSRSTAVSG